MPNRVVETLSLAKVEAKTPALLVFVNFEQLIRRPCSRTARHFSADGFDLVQRHLRRAVAPLLVATDVSQNSGDFLVGEILLPRRHGASQLLAVNGDYPLNAVQHESNETTGVLCLDPIRSGERRELVGQSFAGRLMTEDAIRLEDLLPFA